MLFGTMRFGAKTAEGGTALASSMHAPTDRAGNPVDLDVTVSLPDLQIDAETRGAFALEHRRRHGGVLPRQAARRRPDLMIDESP